MSRSKVYNRESKLFIPYMYEVSLDQVGIDCDILFEKPDEESEDLVDVDSYPEPQSKVQKSPTSKRKSTVDFKLDSSIKPSYYSKDGNVPVFEPTFEEFKNFSMFVEKILCYGMESGIVKVIPPKEWKDNLPPIPENLIKSTTISEAIKQEFQGTAGIYNQLNLMQKKSMSILDWKQLCETPEHKTPSVSDDSSPLSNDSCSSCGQQSPGKNQIGLSDILPSKKYPPASNDEFYKELERQYWKNLVYFSPLYGADIKGSLFDRKVKEWNVSKLPNILNCLPLSIPGVNSPYLYFGMWKSTFAWHLEDIDLFSINYIHFGAPKQWYSIPQSHVEQFERFCQATFANDFKKCSQFMRHKTFHINPSVIKNQNIPVNKVIQEEGEFILTFPYGYHSGYNIGYNCAESINFAIDSWIPIGKKSKSCQCSKDSVKIDVELLFEGTVEGKKSKSFFDSICVFCGKERGSEKDGFDLISLYPERSCSSLSYVPALAHRCCAWGIPECSIEKLSDGSEVVVDVDSIPKERWKLNCVFCRFSGAPIQCSKGKCVKAYHVYCAMKNGIKIEEKVGEEGEQYLESFCFYHSSEGKKRKKSNVKENTNNEVNISTIPPTTSDDKESLKDRRSSGWVKLADGSYSSVTIKDYYKDSGLCKVEFIDVSIISYFRVLSKELRKDYTEQRNSGRKSMVTAKQVKQPKIKLRL